MLLAKGLDPTTLPLRSVDNLLQVTQMLAEDVDDDLLGGMEN